MKNVPGRCSAIIYAYRDLTAATPNTFVPKVYLVINPKSRLLLSASGKRCLPESIPHLAASNQVAAEDRMTAVYLKESETCIGILAVMLVSQPEGTPE